MDVYTCRNNGDKIGNPSLPLKDRWIEPSSTVEVVDRGIHSLYMHIPVALLLTCTARFPPFSRATPNNTASINTGGDGLFLT